MNPMTLNSTKSEVRVDLKPIERIVRDVGCGPDAVVPILHAIQQHYHYLPQPALRRVCELTEITPATITGVSTFYDSFRHRPTGRHVISVCHGTACHVRGSWMIQEAIEQALDLAPGTDTDADNRFTVVRAACFGCCTLAPIVRIDDETFGNLNSQDVSTALAEFLAMTANPALVLGKQAYCGRSRRPVAKSMDGRQPPGEIRIGLDSCCVAQGCGKVYGAISDALQATGANARLKRVGCQTMCHQTPLVQIVPSDGDSTFYAQVQPEHARDLVLRHFRPRGVLKRFGLCDRPLDRPLAFG